MGIGGLDKQFGDIFRRAFASRTFPASLTKKLGIHHVKGILLCVITLGHRSPRHEISSIQHVHLTTHSLPDPFSSFAPDRSGMVRRARVRP